MLFNSYIFIFLFLPLCLAGYFGLNHFKKYRLAQVFLLLMSLWFYGYFNPGYLLIILSSVVINYAFYKGMSAFPAPERKKAILIIGLAANVGILVYFKYMDFFLSTCNQIFKTDFALLHVVLPLGISFFTFQQLSFVIDAYRGEVPGYNFLEYACYVTYFPQLIAGPIVTHDELIPQFRDVSKKQFDWENFSKGIYLFVLGLSKKVLLADTFGNAANVGFADIGGLNAAQAILTMLSYTIQIYFDFSGYCDMAVGLGKMMNFTLPVNFNSPYKALTITEFWNRWHMTLTRFFTRYIYIPLGGSRKGELRTYLNTFLVFFISGFWHGAGFTFLFWGICHGIFTIITKKFKSFFDALHPALNWIITFGFVNVAWVFFRADSIRDAFRLLNRIALFRFGPIGDEFLSCFKLPELVYLVKRIPFIQNYTYLLLLAFFAAALFIILGKKNAYERMIEFQPSVKNLLSTSILLVWCVFSFAGVSTFLYFNF